MMRALVGWLLSWFALRLATTAHRLLNPPGQAGHTSEVGAIARGGSVPLPAAPEGAERYVRELVRIDLVRADGVLGFVLGAGPCLYFMGTFAKQADLTWRQ